MELTSKELRILKLMEKYEQPNLESSLKEFHTLVDTLLYLNETLRVEQTQIHNWQKYSESLLFKFSLHALTLYEILSGMTLKSHSLLKELNNIKVLDSSSSKVILRSQLETLLMYYHIYVNPQDDDEKQLKYYAWIYSSLLQRARFPTETEKGKIQKAKDKVEIENIKTLIQGLKSFNNLSKKQQTTLLNTGSGKLFNHWATILSDTGFKENHAITIMYNYLSMYAHSEGLSVIQLSSGSFAYEKNVEDIIFDINTSKLLVCLMIDAITKLFKPIETKFKTLDENLQTDIDFYCKLAFFTKL